MNNVETEQLNAHLYREVYGLYSKAYLLDDEGEHRNINSLLHRVAGVTNPNEVKDNALLAQLKAELEAFILVR